jgi:hypothetical protein
MHDELASGTDPRLDASDRPVRLPGPPAAGSTDEPSPFDEEIAAAEARLATAIAERERCQDGVFLARDGLARARANGGRAQAEAALADARRAWDAAGIAEGKARVHLTSLSVVRSDWRRARDLGAGER